MSSLEFKFAALPATFKLCRKMSMDLTMATAPTTSSYRLTAGAKAVSEGGRVTFTLRAPAEEIGKRVAYAISGISADDLDEGSLSGELEITAAEGGAGTATLTLAIKADQRTEGLEMLQMAVAAAVAEVAVYDTSRQPTYAFTPGAASVREGETATFLLTTTNIPDGTVLDYTISGVQSEDVLGGLTGQTVVVSRGQAVIAIPTVVDLVAESQTVRWKDKSGQEVSNELKGFETLTLTVGNASTSVRVMDSVVQPGFKLTPLAGVGTSYRDANGDGVIDKVKEKFNSANEGTELKLLLETIGLSPGAAVRYELSGSANAADVGNPWGGTWGVTKVSGTFASGRAVISLPIQADRVTEGAEDLTITVGNQSFTVTINDTSKAPVYTLKPVQAQVREGQPALFLITSDAAPGSWVDYRIAGDVTADDLAVPLAGTVQLDAGSRATLRIPTRRDGETETPEALTVEIVGSPARATCDLIDSP